MISSVMMNLPVFFRWLRCRALPTNLVILVSLLAALPLRPGTSLSAEVPSEGFDVTADRLEGSRVGDEEVVTLLGNVKIVHGTTTAFADTGFYEKAREKIRLAGNVRVMEQGVEVRGSQGEYFRAERRLVLPRGVEVLESGGTLKAERGVYDIAGDSVTVEGNVVYAEGMKSFRSDRAVYLRAVNLIVAWGNVVMIDADYGASVTAGRVTYRRDTRFGQAREKPVLEILARENREAITVTADSMDIYADQKRAVAIGDVHILRGKAGGQCGRAVFLDLEDKSVLYDSPTLVQEASSLSGDSITIYSKDEKISRVLVTGSAKCIYLPEKGERSELAGRDITLNFENDELAEMVVTGGAAGVFTPAAGDTTGFRNDVRGASMVLGFEDGEVKTATVSGGVRGLYRMEPDSTAGAVGPGEDVKYQSDSLRYNVPASLMYLIGNAVVDYHTMKLSSEDIEYNSKTYNLYATVEPVLWEGGDRITGSSMSYNLRTKRGAVVAGRTRFEKGFYSGRLIRKTGGSTLNVEGGTYTSCDYLDPHYSFTSSKMRISLDDKVIAKPVVLRIRNMPVLALPFYMFSIKRGRDSGILIPRIELGFDQAKGRFIRNVGYYWAPNDYFDAALWGDYYERSRWVVYTESRYSLRYRLSGTLDGSYTRDIVTRASRWDLSGAHNQTIGENGRLVVRADFVSDKSYRRDTSDDLEKALRRVLESSASYSRTSEGKSLTIAAERRENLDAGEITAKLPTASFLLNRKTLFAPAEDKTGWHKGTYFYGGSNLSSLLDRRSGVRKTRQAASLNINLDSDIAIKRMSESIRSRLVLTGERKDAGEWCAGCTGGKRTNSAADLKTDLIAKLNPAGIVNINPSLTASLTLYNEDKTGKAFPLRLLYGGGIDARLTLYRTYFPRIGPLTALRHVVSPSLSLAHRPDFSKYRGRFYSLSGVSADVSKSSVVNISLANRVQAKLGKGSETRKIDDLFVLNTSTSYDFLYRDKGKTTPLSMITSSMRFYPSTHTTFDLAVSHEPEHFSLKSLDFQTRFSYAGKGPLPPGLGEPEAAEEPRVPEEETAAEDTGSPTANPWRLDMAYRYTKGFGGAKDNYWFETTMGFNLTRHWRVEYGGRFDLSGKQTVYQEYSIYRDLHCWEARFVRRYSNATWEYYFRLNIKAHPEIYAERGLRALYRSY